MANTGPPEPPITPSPVAPSPELVALSLACGVETRYTDWTGREVAVGAGTLTAVLAALGIAADTPEQVAASLSGVGDKGWDRPLPACVVCRQGTPSQVALRLPATRRARLWIDLEDGGTTELATLAGPGESRMVAGVLVRGWVFAIPGDLPLGWHRLRAETGGQPATAELAVTPDRLAPPGAAATARAAARFWGLTTHFYTVRSASSWGIGELTDLECLVGWAGAELGADFVLVNPVHAVAPTLPVEPSPYLPTTRRYRNPLYIRVGAVPESASVDLSRYVSAATALNGADGIDHDLAWAFKEAALREVFQVARTPAREAAFEDYRDREGTALVRFATWCAIAQRHGPRWTSWPTELRDPDSEAVRAFAASAGSEIRFFCWLQWIVDEQLAAVQSVARAAGMSIGLCADLAVGVDRAGADSWHRHDAFASGIAVGVPADQNNHLGQNWQQPPWRPDALAELGYAPYRDLLRSALRHCGALRIDHVMGLFRLWWIPDGGGPLDGTYVRYDHEAMVGILALEAHRAGALVVGEDIGVVEPWVRDYLDGRGVLGTSVLWYERDETGPRAPQTYRPQCLTTVTTHDLPPTVGYLTGAHIELRWALDLFTRPLADELAADEAERREVLQMLVRHGLLAHSTADAGAAEPEEAVRALYAFLVRTPAALLGVAVTDLVGDVRILNQPGTSNDRYPNWRLPLAGPDRQLVTLEDLLASKRARALAEAVDVALHGACRAPD